MTGAARVEEVAPPDAPTRTRVPGPVIDLGAVLTLTIIGLLGFHASFGGWGFLLTGVAGCLLGLALSWLASRLAMPAVSVVAAAMVVVAVLGGVLALRATAIAGVVPTVDTLRGLAQGFTRGWLDLAATPPPAGDLGDFLAIPYLCGFLSGLIGLSFALRGGREHLAILAPMLVLAASILTGLEQPVALVAQGSLFALVTVAWWSWRGTRRRQVLATATTGWRRTTMAVALLSVAAVLGLVVGPRLPGADANERLLLRKYVEPELDLTRYPSPLSGVRKYLMTEEQRARVLFTVTGLPAGTPLRLAVLDTWDGTVAGVAGTVDAASSGQFRRIGSTVPTSVTGVQVPATIEVKGYNDFWVPTAGGTAVVEVDGPRADDVRRTLFYNAATDSAITTAGLTTGDRISVEAVIPPAVADPASLTAATAPQPTLAKVPDTVVETASDLAEAGSPYARAGAVAEYLRNEAFYVQHGSPFLDRPPGHGYKRLDDLAGDDQWIGDEEQYGALALLMGREAQVPTRLVLGFRDHEETAAAQPQASTESWDVTGEDLDVWLEVGLQGAGWVPIFQVSPPRDQIPAQTEEPKPKPRPEVQVPPKPEPNPGSESVVEDLASDEDKQAEPEPAGVPAWVGALAVAVGVPLLLLGLYAALVVALKRRRRRNRRGHPDPGTAIAGGWAEVLDRARDSGVALPPAACTRREASVHLSEAMPTGGELVSSMARRADAAVFAPEPPSAHQVAAYWADVATADRVWLTGRGQMARLRARLSPRSLRSARSRRAPRRWPIGPRRGRGS